MKLFENLYVIQKGKTTYRFLPTGDIFDFNHQGTMLNEFRGNAIDGSPNNIYLRIYKEDSVHAYPLLGIRSKSVLKKGMNSLVFSGTVSGISYEVTFYGLEGIWFWDVVLKGNGETVDLLYGQDIGVSSAGSVLTNELYVSQYLGHSIFCTKNGYTVCSRQNQEQTGNYPYLRQGSVGIPVVHYATDGMQFFKTSYKDSNIPGALLEALPDVNYQFEFSYTALQTEKFSLASPVITAFYGLAKENHPEAIEGVEYEEEIKTAYTGLKKDLTSPCPVVTIRQEFGIPYSSPALTTDEISELFPERVLEEYEDNTLLSFFTIDHSHIVTKEKELRTERPHGTIIMTCPNVLTDSLTAATTDEIGSNTMASTAYMYGLFGSQTILGNTSFHKLLSTSRGLLNIQKNCGQHLYIKLSGTYRLLTLPALFEMGMNYARWYYVLPGDLLRITSYTAVHSTYVILKTESLQKKRYDFILTNQLVLGETEYSKEITYETLENGLRFKNISEEYPELHYDMLFAGTSFKISDDRIFFENTSSVDDSFLTVQLKETSAFSCIIKGSTDSNDTEEIPDLRFEKEKAAALDFYRSLNRGFHLTGGSPQIAESVEILNQTAWWYTHNAMIHFASPHGLEQPGGAAWGTRDVCQGPMEYFLMTQNYTLVRKVLLNIFSHQYVSTGEWPQWFMFDRYTLDAGECHGDVVFWPLKCIGDYLEQTGNYDLLLTPLPYADAKTSKDSLLLHIKKAFKAIQARFIADTGLITYAGGDWDDTLQPVDPTMSEHLVSSWTVALAYQTLKHLGNTLTDIDPVFAEKLTEDADKILRDFNTFLIKDEVIPGFVSYDKGDIKYILHPEDSETGISYRLLPMTRSIISELVTPKQALKNMEVIGNELKFPDGVHLMDHPADYKGGVSKLFKRAEQAANVGREISLLYTHAHIRYLEACAKTGDGTAAWEGLFTINPILIKNSVKTACPRQSNMYFSSSDGSFTDRYDFAENFKDLKAGEIPVKGGWRLYSSGPGIYLNQLVSNILGIRFLKDALILDPVLPENLNGLSLTFKCFGKDIAFHYHIHSVSNKTAVSSERISIYANETKLEGEPVLNPYRKGGIKLHKKVLEKDFSQLNIFIKL
ncbi:GH36-type glycosyl hydrolase domain-containing protein [Anaerocolumna sp. MB42-C2]|uniref:GH36-type glycosyl hydrolase domain-containing protein n=1 Tax=Anaerocolumna sp. MB42-C2 TaxID=3070997 RepID=UPI0027DF2453|nr:cellobiose phosphorylase [Anaerocolumna sp. MB42-C2]WMJ86719.1 cellobiose phosphorylase [Anaerocolumna sp. MB42-C2]